MRAITTPYFSQYNPPGVYVDPVAAPPLIVTGIDPTVVCIIGRAQGFRTYAENVSFANEDTATLSKKGIVASSIKVTGYVTDPAQAGLSIPKTFTIDETSTAHDYHIAVDATAGVDESSTVITRTTGGAIETAHPQVRVSYRYTDSDYHAVHVFDDFDAIQALYGPSFDPSTGDVASPMTLACQEAILNGANYLYTVALSGVGTAQQQFNDAYAQLSDNFDANVIVPLFEGFTTDEQVLGILSAVQNYAYSTLQDGHTRVFMCGFDKAWTPSFSAQAQITNEISSERVVAVWPNQYNIYDGVTNTGKLCDGFYMAAALAGIMARQPSQEPITRKRPRGFMSIPGAVSQTMTKSTKNLLAENGWLVMETDRRGRMVCRHGLTTNYSGGILLREISLVRSQDTLYNLIQDTLVNAGIIGTVITKDTPLRVKGIVSGALELAMANELIYGYTNLKVRQEGPPSGDPTIIEVKFAYQPSYPLNYVLVQFTVDTATGAISNTTDTNFTDNDAISQGYTSFGE